MRISKDQIEVLNRSRRDSSEDAFNFLADQLGQQNIDVDKILDKLIAFQVAIPSWALGAGGTRFGRFSFPGEPGTLEEKLEDVGLLHALCGSAGAISLHIPWDVPSDIDAVKELAQSLNIRFDAVNSNTFQDQIAAVHSYKYGSLSHSKPAVREQAIAHNIEVIKLGEQLGSKALTVWLADGSNFPGQRNFQRALENTQTSLQKIYAELPHDWKMLIEYKPYEPNFYSTVIQDWGTSLLLANACGPNAHTLVDLGHHLPNTNIEQIVATLMSQERLGGFHFNDSKYGDDDLTVGSIKPYALFLIFNELVYGMARNSGNPDLAWMIDASHNVKDPLEDLLQSVEAIMEAYAKALLVDQHSLRLAQENYDAVMAQELLQNAFRTDVRPMLEQARLQCEAAISPLAAYRELQVRDHLVDQRGIDSRSSGL